MQREILTALIAARAAGTAVVLLTPLHGGPARLLSRAELAHAALEPALRDAALASLREDRARRYGGATASEDDAGELLLTPFNPPLRLVIVGAVHIAQPLTRIASLAEYAVTIVEPRAAFAQARQFPPATLRTDWPDEALRALRLDARTAVVTLAHDPKIDDPALRVALGSEAFYVGALGSTRTHARRLERLAAMGLTREQLARIDGPAGLRIAARTPPEIAIAIVGRMTAVLRAAGGS